MKLVINVDEYKIESCKRRKKEGWNEWYHNMILEGKPFNDELVKELEKISVEIQKENNYNPEINQTEYICGTNQAYKNVISIIDKHIAELKGESR